MTEQTQFSPVHRTLTPAIGYPFGKGEVTGWIDVHLTATGAQFHVKALDAKHEKHGKTVEVQWRKA